MWESGLNAVLNRKAYLLAHGLTATTLKSLRSARDLEEFNRTGDAFRVQRLLNHADFAQAIYYLASIRHMALPARWRRYSLRFGACKGRTSRRQV